MKSFSLTIDKRYSSVVVAIIEGDMGIGSIFLSIDDKDLIPLVQEMINGFNKKYTEIPPQTTTGGDSKQSRSISSPVTTGQHPIRSPMSMDRDKPTPSPYPPTESE